MDNLCYIIGLMADSILTTLLNDLNTTKNHGGSMARCRAIIGEIETLTNKRVLAYFSSDVGKDHNTWVNDEDVFIIENLLSVPSTKKDLLLILQSNGGLAISAERIIDVCKNYCSKRKDESNFIVVVAKKAKSAATIIALGANKVYLRSTAELGPVDPQMNIQDAQGTMQITPAYIIVDALENLMPNNGTLKEKLSSFFNRKHLSKLPKEIKQKLFEQNSYPLYVQSKNELNLSESIIAKISKEKINEKISESDFNIFKDPHITKSHGRLINLSDLSDNPLHKEKIIDNLDTLLSKEDEGKKLDSLIWELYVRRRQLVNDSANTTVKTIESTDEIFLINGKKFGQP